MQAVAGSTLKGLARADCIFQAWLAEICELKRPRQAITIGQRGIPRIMGYQTCLQPRDCQRYNHEATERSILTGVSRHRSVQEVELPCCHTLVSIIFLDTTSMLWRPPSLQLNFHDT
jgi:hypothetical protein